MESATVLRSNFAGLRFREPVYRTLRELVMSYFEHYFNLAGEKTLRNYSRPVNLARFDQQAWMTAEEEVWFIPHYLQVIPHIPLLRPELRQGLTRLDAGSFGLQTRRPQEVDDVLIELRVAIQDDVTIGGRLRKRLPQLLNHPLTMRMRPSASGMARCAPAAMSGPPA